jgi:hypothetical protein
MRAMVLRVNHKSNFCNESPSTHPIQANSIAPACRFQIPNQRLGNSSRTPAFRSVHATGEIAEESIRLHAADAIGEWPVEALLRSSEGPPCLRTHLSKKTKPSHKERPDQQFADPGSGRTPVIEDRQCNGSHPEWSHPD